MFMLSSWMTFWQKREFARFDVAVGHDDRVHSGELICEAVLFDRALFVHE
jgi:hypothetical protein